jgi:hypothetical protein
MVLRDNVTIRSLGKQVWDLLTEPNRIGQYMPGVVKIRIIEPNIKKIFVSRYVEERKREHFQASREAVLHPINH